MKFTFNPLLHSVLFKGHLKNVKERSACKTLEQPVYVFLEQDRAINHLNRQLKMLEQRSRATELEKRQTLETCAKLSYFVQVNGIVRSDANKDTLSLLFNPLLHSVLFKGHLKKVDFSQIKSCSKGLNRLS